MAEQISDFTALTTPVSADLVPIVDVSDTTDAATGTTKKIAVSDLIGYTSYVCQVTQAGTATLGQTVIGNTTGITSAWTRDSVGVYWLDFTGITGTFYSDGTSDWAGKAILKNIFPYGGGSFVISGGYFYWWDNANKKVYLYIFNGDGSAAIDLNVLLGTSALFLPEIRFYN